MIIQSYVVTSRLISIFQGLGISVVQEFRGGVDNGFFFYRPGRISHVSTYTGSKSGNAVTRLRV